MTKTLTLVKKTENQAVKDVYDIEVENSHHYILNNGLVSHNSGVIFAASIVVALQKRKLREDEDGNKISDTTGIRSAIEVRKSRYAKPFEKMEIKIPYDSGLSPYSGLTDMMEKRGLLRKDGNRLAYDDENGEVVKMYRKAFERNENGVLDELMRLYQLRKEEYEGGLGEHEEHEVGDDDVTDVE